MEKPVIPELLLHHISYPVRDVEASATFYESLFGLRRLSRPPIPIPGVWLGCGDREIHLVYSPDGTYRDGKPADFTDVHFAFWTGDFDGMVARLESAGFSANLPEGDLKGMLILREGISGFPQLYVLDPDRNTIEINAAPM